MWLNFGRHGEFLIIIDQDAGTQLRLNNGAAKACARFLMKELNVTKATLELPGPDGSKIEQDLFEYDGNLKEYRDKNN